MVGCQAGDGKGNRRGVDLRGGLRVGVRVGVVLENARKRLSCGVF